MSLNLSIKVEPLNGANPEEVCRDMIALARKLGVLVEADMNGVPLVAGLIDTPESLMTEWRKRMKQREEQRAKFGLLP